MSVNWPQQLVSDIARRRCVIFLGSGISAQAQNTAGLHPKMWREFLDAATARINTNDALKRQIQKLIKGYDYLTACQLIKDGLGTADFHNCVREEFLTPQFQSAPIHDSIIDLDSRIVATPNFDKIFENRINHLQNNSVAVKNYYESDVAEAVRETGRVVIKVHGTIDTPANMIFTRNEYARARHLHRGFYAVLEALVITNTFLFLGCGLSDPDIRLLLEDYAFRHDYGRPHYFVLPNKQVHALVAPAIERSLNIRILRYDPKNNHELLKASIEDLGRIVEAERAKLQLSQDW